ncbi:hypothetical protein H072_11481 [Dactylellina haptotyla CBS 200.50]|uniref:Metallo-beta-lactamase domain-containing protein n=1 Tax=Dactylellina haptotyla (strain CBS 200.50) TaxID=1284197 RepID=S8A1Y4_DACHA|nr:hypothetical protein H072_11481 [Dactylellina haptotyla CBS 200.50]
MEQKEISQVEGSPPTEVAAQSEHNTSIPQAITPRTRPTFATPLLQPTRSQTLHWTLPQPFQQHKLVGRSRAAWHTSFLVPSLNTVLDAGVLIDDSRPQNVFITHGHSDHSYNILAYCRRITPPDIYVPAETARFMDDYILSSKALNLGFPVRSYHNFDQNGVGNTYLTVEGRLTPRSAPASRSMTPSPNRASNAALRSKLKAAIVKETGEPSQEDLDEDEDPSTLLLPTHNIVPVTTAADAVFTLKTHPAIKVSILPRNHTVPSVGFMFTQTSNRLKPAYRTLPGLELRDLRQQGVEITYQHRTPIFAFLGDGDHTSLLGDPEWLTGNEEKGLSHCPVVITECSFLYESHRAQAVKTLHTLWADLEPIVRRHTQTTWVLMHFSKRYSDAEIVEFFENLSDTEAGCPFNIVVWVDGGNEITEKAGSMMI